MAFFYQQRPDLLQHRQDTFSPSSSRKPQGNQRLGDDELLGTVTTDPPGPAASKIEQTWVRGGGGSSISHSTFFLAPPPTPRGSRGLRTELAIGRQVISHAADASEAFRRSAIKRMAPPTYHLCSTFLSQLISS